MPNNVLHIVRKSSQLKSTFIKNQIESHIRYNPYIVFKEKSDRLYDGGYADFDTNKYEILALSELNLRFKYLKKISSSDIEEIEKFIKEKSIDILHLHYGTDAGLYKKLIDNCGIPSLISFYGYEVSSFPKMFFGLGKHYLNHRVFNTTAKITAMTEDMKNDLVKLGCNESKIIVHYHGVGGDVYYYPEREYRNRDKIILLIVSYLAPQKGHRFLIDSIKEIVNRGNRNFELRIIGTGELEKELKDYVRSNNLDYCIKFLGPMKAHSPEILNEYKNADIFAHPSVVPKNGDKEGIPGTVVEAMFCGLPVVSTYHAGIPYVIENGKTGLLVKEWDIKKLSDNIELLMTNVELRKNIGTNAMKYAMENLILSKKEAILENIYDDVIKSFKNNKNIVS
jgi:colanic acid/amylovoran biosynthesis glycosyltransferase